MAIFIRVIFCMGGGKLYLIDFDYSRKDDIQAYDAFYYIFEKERAEIRGSWPLCWLELYTKKGYLLDKYANIVKEIIDMPFEEIMIIFFIERLGIEYTHGYMVNKNEVAMIVDKIVKR